MLTIWLTLSLAAALAGQETTDAVAEARRLVAEGRSLDALRHLEAASRERADDAAVHHALGALYASGGRLDEAVASVTRAVALAPEDLSYAHDLGELLLRSGRAEEAVPHLERAAAQPNALLLLAAAHERLGSQDAQFDALSRYLDEAPDDLGARLLFGEQLTAAKRPDDAVRVYRDGLALAPEEPALLYRLAEALTRTPGSGDEAFALVRRALGAAPDALEPGLLHARLLARGDRHDDALAELERLRGLHPDEPRVHYQLVAAYQRAGRADEARAAGARFQELSEAEREASEREARVAVTYKRAVDLLRRGDLAGAETALEETLAIEPRHAQTRSMLAKIAFSRGDLPRARREIDEALAIDDRIAELHYLSALFHRRAGDPAAALPAAQRALELDPAFPDAWSMLGSMLLDAGRAREALDCFEKAAALEPSNAAVHLNLASAHAALGDDAAERAAMERYRALSERP